MQQQRTDFVVSGGPMTAVLAQLRRVAPLDTCVLLYGESGTGKELAARFLHQNHPRRRNGPLVSVHCGAIPDSLLESELFGHVKGAFTGADRERIGKFEQAHGGTLLLDEIATMTPQAQVRLLRVLQERCVSRVGCNEVREVDVRVVVATNRDLESLIAVGEFRLDLYYRVNTFPVTLPPLRERTGDISPLARYFAYRVAERLGFASPKAFSAEAMRSLCGYAWPGNVRELENAVEYASVQCEHDVIQTGDLPSHIGGKEATALASGVPVIVTEEGLSFRTAVTNLERELILQSLRLTAGNKARAAELLDMKRTTFLEKLRRLEQEGVRQAR